MFFTIFLTILIIWQCESITLDEFELQKQYIMHHENMLHTINKKLDQIENILVLQNPMIRPNFEDFGGRRSGTPEMPDWVKNMANTMMDKITNPNKNTNYMDLSERPDIQEIIRERLTL